MLKIPLLLFVCIFHITIFSAGVSSEVSNGKYSNHNAHRKRLRNLVNLPESANSMLRSSGRHTRSTNGDKATDNNASKDKKIAVSKFQFMNSENADHVFVNILGENSTQKIFILMVNFDFSKGWASVKKSTLWCSEDHGESFHVRNFLQDAKISFMQTFTSNPQKMILTDAENKMIYTTEDGLVHNSSHSVPVEPDLLIPHPSNETKLLIYGFTEQKLYGSENFGETWTLVAENVITPFYWGHSDLDASEDVVHMQIEGEIPSQAFYKACLLPGCQPVSGDLQVLEKAGLFMAGTLMVHNEFIFVQKENQIRSESFLMVSYRRGLFNRAQFPTNDITNNFQILNVEDHQVFVAVHHGDTVNLYLSDETGQYYVLSLADVFHDEKPDWFEIDFAEVKGMNWTYLANKILKRDSLKPDFVQTYVSYDKGGNWAPLFVNQSCSKIESCSLLLELKYTFEVDSVSSAESAPGIILGHGLLGQGHQKRQSSIFVTNNGGATWEQAPLNSTCFLRILNYGGILTAIPDEPWSKTVHYSLDQGKSWQSQKFDEKGLSIIDWIAVEKTQDALVQNMFGRESTEKPWKYVKLDMTSLLPKKCDDEDYEIWSPKDYNAGDSTNKCVLGRVVQYNRRKPEAVCNNEEISTYKVMNNSVCLCTNEDYECDFGFEKADDGCRKAAWLDSSFVPSECDNGGDYFQSQGYRKIPADVCTENEADKKKYDRKRAACPSAAPKGLSLMTEMKTIPVGKQITFSLEQARGSKWDTQYTWDFGDTSETVSVTGFKNASQEQHTFQTSGSFNITVTAENKKGKAKASFAIRVQDRLTKLRILAPWALVINQDVKINVLPMSISQVFPTSLDSIHYLWSFGDEAPNSRSLLSWNSSMTHSYAKAGTYNIIIEASNSISSVSEEFEVRIFESAMILELQLEVTSTYFLVKNSLIASFLTQSIRQQVAQELGLHMDRLVAISSSNQSVAYLYLFPTQRENEMSVTQIRDKIIEQANKGLLAFDLFNSHLSSKDLIKIVSAKELSGPPEATDKKSGPNLTPVFIAVPMLAAVFISLAVLGVCFYRRKRRSGARYSLFETQDESDTMLDDEDVAPLNMNLEISGGASTIDDSLIDSGRNCLVMETGGGIGGSEEVC